MIYLVFHHLSKKYKPLLVLIFTIFNSNILYGQKTLHGTIQDDSSSPIAFAHIFWRNDRNGTISNINGRFSIAINERSYQQDSLIIRHVGYKELSLPLNELLSVNEINITLIPDLIFLESVSVHVNDPNEIFGILAKNVKHELANLTNQIYTFQHLSVKDSSSVFYQIRDFKPNLVKEKNSIVPAFGTINKFKINDYQEYENLSSIGIRLFNSASDLINGLYLIENIFLNNGVVSEHFEFHYSDNVTFNNIEVLEIKYAGNKIGEVLYNHETMLPLEIRFSLMNILNNDISKIKIPFKLATSYSLRKINEIQITQKYGYLDAQYIPLAASVGFELEVEKKKNIHQLNFFNAVFFFEDIKSGSKLEHPKLPFKSINDDFYFDN